MARKIFIFSLYSQLAHRRTCSARRTLWQDFDIWTELSVPIPLAAECDVLHRVLRERVVITTTP